jgi:hypothetical protein
LRRSTKPSSLKPAWKAVRKFTKVRGEPLLRKPITGVAGCCARAASGHATAAPPTSVMNSRRLTVSPPQAKTAYYHTIV